MTMADKTGIQWTDATWNPVIGCRRVSEGCRNCYAEFQAMRIVAQQRANGNESEYVEVIKTRDCKRCEGTGTLVGRWVTGKEYMRSDCPTCLGTGQAPAPLWNGKCVFLPKRLDQPLRWTKPRMVFVNSMSDLFHEDLTFPQIAAVFGVMAAAEKHTFQVLTKRPGRIREFFDWLDGMAQRAAFPKESIDWRRRHILHAAMLKHVTLKKDPGTGSDWPIPNVWLGTSVEDQDTADVRIPLLLQSPAAIRFLSAEPLLGALDLEEVPWRPYADLHWVIVGGESGSGARECDASWVREIVQTCQRAGVAVFVKQLGKHVIHHGCTGPGEHWPDGTKKTDNGRGTFDIKLVHHKAADPEEWPEDLRVREWPKIDE